MTVQPQRRSVGQLVEVVLHLAKREIASQHRWTLLGWTWPLARQLAQLGVLVFIFGSVIDLKVHDYPVFVFSGLIAFTWFSNGVSSAATSLIAKRHLVFQPRVPPSVIPLVAIATPAVDALMAIPVLVIMLAVTDNLHWTGLLFPLVLSLQVVLMCGLAWLGAGASVYLRDVPNIIGVGLMLLFYATPVFYALSAVGRPQVLELNPLGVLIDASRALLLGTAGPSPLAVAAVAVFSAAVAAGGFLLFKRLEPGFVDQL